MIRCFGCQCGNSFLNVCRSIATVEGGLLKCGLKKNAPLVHNFPVVLHISNGEAAGL